MLLSGYRPLRELSDSDPNSLGIFMMQCDTNFERTCANESPALFA